MAASMKSATRKKIKKRLIERDGDKCFYCKNVDKKMTIDHVVPLSKGGENKIHNLVLACEQCNSKKDSFSPKKIVIEKLKLRTQSFYLSKYNYDYLARIENSN